MTPPKSRARRQCKGITKAGHRCKRSALPRRAHCACHLPPAKQGKSTGKPQRNDLGQYRAGNDTQWKPGQSGNPQGRTPKAKCITNMLEELLDTIAPVPNNTQGRTWRQVLAQSLLVNAVKGNAAIAKEILNRIEGVQAPGDDGDRGAIRVAKFVEGDILEDAEGGE